MPRPETFGMACIYTMYQKTCRLNFNLINKTRENKNCLMTQHRVGWLCSCSRSWSSGCSVESEVGEVAWSSQCWFGLAWVSSSTWLLSADCSLWAAEESNMLSAWQLRGSIYFIYLVIKQHDNMRVLNKIRTFQPHGQHRIRPAHANTVYFWCRCTDHHCDFCAVFVSWCRKCDTQI